MPDPTTGRRASDQVAIRNATEIAVMESRLKVQEDESARNRSFRHETNQTLQKVVSTLENLGDDVKALVQLAPRLNAAEEAMKTHNALDEFRYTAIETYMAESSTQRAAIQLQQTTIIDKMNTKDTKALIYALGVAVAIIGALLWRFGLPPMGP